MISVVKRDILTMNCDVIAHQVNCRGFMGAGLAKQIRDKYPTVYTRYKKYCPDASLLGKIQVLKTNKVYIANLFAQVDIGTNSCHTNYNALEKCFRTLCKYMVQNNLHSVAIPYGIGCGLAGGDWKIVSKIIKDVFAGESLALFICKKEVK